MTPITVALVNDYEVIVHGLKAMLGPFSDRVRVVDMEVKGEPKRHAQVALFDTFAGRHRAIDRCEQMSADGLVDHVVLYTWDAGPEFLDDAHRAGVSGVILKSHSGEELVADLEAVVAGHRIGLNHVARGRRGAAPDDLSQREREVLALVALGYTNREIATELYVSIDTVKTHVRRLFGKLGVTNRTRAAAMAPKYGLSPPAARAG